MIPLFGLLMGGLVTALWGILSVAYAKNWRDQQDINGFCGAMFCVVPVMLAIFVGAGLFAAEVERGTMPLLLALPFSRRQMWVGKTLAGLALMLSAVAMVIVPGAIATRPALEEIGFWQFAPELALASALLYFGAVFWSTVLASIVNAFLSAIATGTGLVLIAIALLAFGGRLFGPPLLDVEVWALAAIPGLIAGSYLGFVRGEAFLGKRRWRMPLTVALAVYLVTMVVLGGFARSLTRYDRSQVYEIGSAAVTGNGGVVSGLTYASPVRLTREVEVKLAGRQTAGDRRVYSVALDPDTGRELLVRREAGLVEVSPDGTHAVLLSPPRPLTWRGERSGPWPVPIIEIWDLTRKRMTYRGVASAAGGRVAVQAVHWSADGKWIGLTTPEWEAGARVLFIGLDGIVRREITAPGSYPDWGSAWDYAPEGAVVYALEAGTVTRHHLATGKSEEIWSIKAGGLNREDWDVPDASLAASPDGKRVAVAMTAYLRREVATRVERRDSSSTPRSLIAVFEPDTSRTLVVSSSEESVRGENVLDWTSDSSTLYCTSPISVGDNSRRIPKTKIAVWRVGQAQAEAVILPTWGCERAVLRDNRLLVSWSGETWVIDPHGRAASMGGPLTRSLAHTSIAGIAKQGHLIVTKWQGEERWAEGVPGVQPASYLAAIDVDTGQLTKVYP
jgi:hypothetical protein